MGQQDILFQSIKRQNSKSIHFIKIPLSPYMDNISQNSNKPNTPQLRPKNLALRVQGVLLHEYSIMNPQGSPHRHLDLYLGIYKMNSIKKGKLSFVTLYALILLSIVECQDRALVTDSPFNWTVYENILSTGISLTNASNPSSTQWTIVNNGSVVLTSAPTAVSATNTSTNNVTANVTANSTSNHTVNSTTNVNSPTNATTSTNYTTNSTLNQTITNNTQSNVASSNLTFNVTISTVNNQTSNTTNHNTTNPNATANATANSTANSTAQSTNLTNATSTSHTNQTQNSTIGSNQTNVSSLSNATNTSVIQNGTNQTTQVNSTNSSPSSSDQTNVTQEQNVTIVNNSSNSSAVTNSTSNQNQTIQTIANSTQNSTTMNSTTNHTSNATATNSTGNSTSTNSTTNSTSNSTGNSTHNFTSQNSTANQTKPSNTTTQQQQSPPIFEWQISYDVKRLDFSQSSIKKTLNLTTTASTGTGKGQVKIEQGEGAAAYLVSKSNQPETVVVVTPVNQEVQEEPGFFEENKIIIIAISSSLAGLFILGLFVGLCIKRALKRRQNVSMKVRQTPLKQTSTSVTMPYESQITPHQHRVVDISNNDFYEQEETALPTPSLSLSAYSDNQYANHTRAQSSFKLVEYKEQQLSRRTAAHTQQQLLRAESVAVKPETNKMESYLF